MLYIVGTPLGNLEDLSFRAAKTLISSDIILAEDTRSAKVLLNYIQKNYQLPITNYQLLSYYKDNEFEKLPETIRLLKAGKTISLISESGMPLINDPGLLLVKTCIKQQIPFTVIPGPTAVTTSLVYSGFNPENFVFLGYLPKKDSQLKNLFTTMRQLNNLNNKLCFVFYESPKRINHTLELIDLKFPTAQICIARELTKKFEEIIRGPASDLKTRTYKGELCLIINLS